MEKNDNKLGLFGLVAIVVSSMNFQSSIQLLMLVF